VNQMVNMKNLLLVTVAAFLLVSCQSKPKAPVDVFSSPEKDPAKLYKGNPIITSIFSADPSAHVWPDYPDRLFLYPSQDIYPARGCDFMDQYHVFSTDNMIDWVDHGMIVERDDLEGRPGWGPRDRDTNFMWAPDAAYSTSSPEKGPYFFYFPVVSMDGRGDWGSNWTVGVAWSDKPYSGFRDNEIVKITLPNGRAIRGPGVFIDPCVFYDKDADTHYLIVGGSQEMRVAKLNKDMVSLAENWTVFSQSKLPNFHEGPWMFTRVNDSGKKLYYLMYAAHKPPDAPSRRGGYLAYAVSTEGPYGPWEFKDFILEGVTEDTNHGSIVEFKGQWYLFYHTDKRSGGAGNLRSVSVEQLFFFNDGTIKKVKSTAYGAPAIGERTSEASLNTAFGEGNWRLELTYEDYLKGKEAQEKMDYPDTTDGYTFGRAYVVANLNRADTPADFVEGTTDLILNAASYVPGSQAVENFHLAGAYAEFCRIDGGRGGPALLEVHYGSAASNAMRLDVNGQRNPLPLQFKFTGGWQNYTGYARVRITLKAGMNRIRLSGGTMNIKSISIYFPE